MTLDELVEEELTTLPYPKQEKDTAMNVNPVELASNYTPEPVTPVTASECIEILRISATERQAWFGEVDPKTNNIVEMAKDRLAYLLKNSPK